MKAQYEKIIPIDTSSFNAYSYEKYEFDAPWHYHPEYELTYIVASKGVRYTGNTFENFQENDLVLLGPNLPHCWRNTGVQNTKASAIVVHFDAEFLGKEWISKPEFSSIRKLLQRSDQGLKFESCVALSIRRRLDDLLSHASFRKLVSLLEILQDLSVAEQVKSLCDRTLQKQLDTNDHERINTIYQFVRARYTHKITLTDIANEVSMGRESFSRFFSKMMSKPFFSFLNEYRINAACKLLIESDLQVTQICYECGFESLPFFYRQFRKYKMNSPQQFRNAYQQISMEAMTDKKQEPHFPARFFSLSQK